MKTSNTHGHHGITFQDNGWGWVIQIKLMGQYRMLRAFASTAEQAARHHDIALAILEAFTPPTTEPNFPDDFRAIPFQPNPADISKEEQDFRAEVLRWRDVLTEKLNASGGDVVDLEIERNRVRHALQEKDKLQDVLAHSKLLVRLGRVHQEILLLRSLSADDRKRLKTLAEEMVKILHVSKS